MMKMNAKLLIIAMCTIHVVSGAGDVAPIDPQATAETKALFHNLRAQMGRGIMFGHQNATLYGIGWHAKDGVVKGRCDVKTAAGVYPVVYGWDLNTVWRPNMSDVQVEFSTNLLRQLVVDAYERGGVNTFSWHMWNPITERNFYDTTPAMSAIAPGGKKHEWYKKQLDRVAAFFKSLKTKKGTLVPVIYRPFHEQNLKCFWWCICHTKQDVYNKVLKFTIEYLRDQKGVHNLLYAVSPSGRGIKDAKQYRSLFPGKNFADLYGIDFYANSSREVLAACRVVVKLADRDGKIAAMTEGGYKKGIGNAPENYYTRDYLGPFKRDETASRIAYFLVWQNAKLEHHWVPVKGDRQFTDFAAFAKDPAVVFGNKIRPMYVLPSKPLEPML